MTLHLTSARRLKPPTCSATYRVELLSAGLGQGGVVTALRLIELNATKRLAPPRPIPNLVEPKLLETALCGAPAFT
jgi:hypothetical protein